MSELSVYVSDEGYAQLAQSGIAARPSLSDSPLGKIEAPVLAAHAAVEYFIHLPPESRRLIVQRWGKQCVSTCQMCGEGFTQDNPRSLGVSHLHAICATGITLEPSPFGAFAAGRWSTISQSSSSRAGDFTEEQQPHGWGKL